MNTTTKMATAALAGTLLLAGCGSDSKSKSEVETIALVQGEPMSVYPGDTLSPENEETRVSIRHEVGEEVKSVTLLEGAASLLRGDYQITE